MMNMDSMRERRDPTKFKSLLHLKYRTGSTARRILFLAPEHVWLSKNELFDLVKSVHRYVQWEAFNKAMKTLTNDGCFMIRKEQRGRSWVNLYLRFKDIRREKPIDKN